MPLNQRSEDQRPREKLLASSAAALSNAELLAILINTGSRNKSAIDLAGDLLRLCDDDLISLSEKSVGYMCKVKGIGEAKAITIVAALELGRRRKSFSRDKEVVFNSPDIAYEELRMYLEDKQEENFVIILLSRSLKKIKTKVLHVGGVNSSIVDVRLIIREICDHTASALIIAHNHPSGALNPSAEDDSITKRIKELCTLLGVTLCDHLIIGHNEYFSYRESGRLMGL